MEVLQGEIYWVPIKYVDAQGHEQKKDRPYVIVSKNQINRMGPNVVGVPLTSRIRKACAHRIKVQLQHQIPNPASKHPLMDCVALTDQIRVLDKGRLSSRRWEISPTPRRVAWNWPFLQSSTFADSQRNVIGDIIDARQ